MSPFPLLSGGRELPKKNSEEHRPSIPSQVEKAETPTPGDPHPEPLLHTRGAERQGSSAKNRILHPSSREKNCQPEKLSGMNKHKIKGKARRAGARNKRTKNYTLSIVVTNRNKELKITHYQQWSQISNDNSIEEGHIKRPIQIPWNTKNVNQLVGGHRTRK